MPCSRPDLVDPLAIAHELISQPCLDLERTLAMLDALPRDMGGKALASVAQALRLVEAAAAGGSSRKAVARYALARVIVMLERERKA